MARLPQIQKGTVQSLGRHDVRAPVSLANQRAGVFAKAGAGITAVIDEYIERQGDMEELEAGLAMTDAHIQFDKKHAGREEYEPREVPSGIQINREREMIPAYEVKADIFRTYSTDAIDRIGKTITDPRRRSIWTLKMRNSQSSEYRRRRESGLKTQKVYQTKKTIALAEQAQDAGQFDKASLIVDSSNLPEHVKIGMRDDIGQAQEIKGVDDAIAANDLQSIELQLGLLADTKDSPYSGYLNSGERRSAMSALRTASEKIKNENKEENARRDSQAATDEIMRENGDKTMEQQLEIARKIKDPTVRDQAVTRIKTRHGERQTQKTMNEKAAIERAVAKLDKNPDDESALNDPELTLSARNMLWNEYHRPVKTNPTIYNEIDRIRLDESERFKTLNLTEERYFKGLSKGDRQFFYKAQQETAKTASYTADASQVNRYLKTFDLKSGSKTQSVKQALAENKIRTGLHTYLQAAADEKGAKLTKAETTKHTDEYFAATVKEAPTIDIRIPLTDYRFVVGGGEISIAAIPSDQMAEIVKQLGESGIPVTSKSIAEAYRQLFGPDAK